MKEIEDLIYKYCNSNSKNYYVDATELLEYLETNGYTFVKSDQYYIPENK